jgi:hypothetical protein
MIACTSCHGTGEILYMPRFAISPESVESATCLDCDGYGWMEPETWEWEWAEDDLVHLLNDADTHPERYAPGEVFMPATAILAGAA